MRLHIVVVGLGQVGRHVAKVLSLENHDVVVIESNNTRVRQYQENLDVQILNGFGTDHRMLEAAGIQDADMIVALSGNDEQNVLTCMMAKHYGVPRKIARIRNPVFFEKTSRFTLADWGVDIAIQPEAETAKEIVFLIKQSTATDVIEFAGGKIQLIGIRLDTPCPVIDRTIQDVSNSFTGLPFRTVAILRGDKTIIPGGSDSYRRDDRVFFVAETTEIPNIVELMGKSDEELHNIMILGGGKIGRAIARLLEKEKDVAIKLIDSDPEKSLILADKLQRTLIIEGDAKDFDLLSSEGLLETDVLVSVTSVEKTNILTSLVAKHAGVRKTIALINREEYIPIMSQIGINATVNANTVTSNRILRLIRRGNIVSVSTLPGVDAEITEYNVSAGDKITKKPLQKCNFPTGAIVGAVTHGDQVIIPVGSTHIQPGDKVIIFSLPQSVNGVAQLFSH